MTVVTFGIVGQENASQNPKKQVALFATIETLLRQGIIRKSTSPHYSQVLLVPKPDNTFRMYVLLTIEL